MLQNSDVQKSYERQVLQDELNIEKQNLATQAEILNRLREQQKSLLREVSVTFPNQISTASVQIQNLSDQLQLQRSSDSAVDSTSDYYLNQITNATKVNQDQLSSSISTTEQTMRELQDRIRFSDTAAATTASATMTGNPALQNLQNLYKEQAQLLSNYREQRARLAVLALQQMQILNNDRQARKADLIDSQTALQDQISSLRNDIAQIEAARLQSQLSLQNIEKEVEQNRKSSEDQSQKVRSLDSALQKKKVSE